MILYLDCSRGISTRLVLGALLENGRVPLAVRTWGGGMLARLLEAEAMVGGDHSTRGEGHCGLLRLP
jgi:hypothetical protein